MLQRKKRLNLAEETELMEKATQRKWVRYTLSGSIVVLVGILVIFFGASLHTGAYSLEGLIIGIGAIVVLIGIIRVLIGLINPSTPRDLQPLVEQPEEEEDVSLNRLTYGESDKHDV
jgi:hypothetical protein